MSSIPTELRFTEEHEWIRDEGDGIVTVGITDYAQDQLGDVTYVELPSVGDEVASGDACGVVESVKTFSDIYAPLTGDIVEVNDTLEDAPETVNESPYDEAWFFKMKPENLADLDDLLDAESYQDLIEGLD